MRSRSALLRKLYELGARYMTLTHTDTLSWADAGTDEARTAASRPFGEDVVRTMNELGMMVDLSHVSPETMHDALEHYHGPGDFFALILPRGRRSSAQRARRCTKRLKEKDGVVMVNFFSGFIVPEATAITKEGMA